MAKTGNTEHLVLHIQAEPTNREKEHVSPWTSVHSSICSHVDLWYTSTHKPEQIHPCVELLRLQSFVGTNN